MKTIFSKRFMAPLAVMILGGAGAFVTTSMSSSKAITQLNGYRYVSQQEPCVEDIKCETNNTGTICTSGSSTLYRLTSPNNCTVPMFKIKNP